MIHDPLCPMFRDDSWNAEPPSVCNCDLIRRVREDERTSQLMMWNRTQEQAGSIVEAGLRPAWQDGYAAALRDAVEAVKALPVNVPKAHAVAAIEALGNVTNPVTMNDPEVLR